MHGKRCAATAVNEAEKRTQITKARIELQAQQRISGAEKREKKKKNDGDGTKKKLYVLSTNGRMETMAYYRSYSAL